jgi:hypothetical protein
LGNSMPSSDDWGGGGNSGISICGGGEGARGGGTRIGGGTINHGVGSGCDGGGIEGLLCDARSFPAPFPELFRDGFRGEPPDDIPEPFLEGCSELRVDDLLEGRSDGFALVLLFGAAARLGASDINNCGFLGV